MRRVARGPPKSPAPCWRGSGAAGPPRAIRSAPRDRPRLLRQAQERRARRARRKRPGAFAWSGSVSLEADAVEEEGIGDDHGPALGLGELPAAKPLDDAAADFRILHARLLDAGVGDRAAEVDVPFEQELAGDAGIVHEGALVASL